VADFLAATLEQTLLTALQMSLILLRGTGDFDVVNIGVFAGIISICSESYLEISIVVGTGAAGFILRSP
jgi:hypothetical protein